jgi:formylglycine-generating enzyme required for sulfatase activity/tRNA A-37 threonylcarbamoyl transferase component Bud32
MAQERHTSAPPPSDPGGPPDATLSASELAARAEAGASKPAPVAPIFEGPDAEVRFQLVSPLARGGMGEVWRALDTRLGREVALKTMLPALAESADVFRRLRTEAELTAQLRHPGVLCVIDAGVFPDGRYWYTMPIVEGRTFSAEIALAHAQVQAGTRAPASALHHLTSSFQRICQIVAHAHERGIIHRDLKPANLMVGRFGEIFVMDWGLAKALDAPDGQAGAAGADPVMLLSPTSETHYGAVMGTPAYMPPEQAAGRTDAVTRRSDVYALGAVLWHMLAGAPPVVTGLDPSGRPDPLRADPALWNIAHAALAPDAAARPADAGEIAAAVESWLDGAVRRAAAVRHLESARRRQAGLVERRGTALALRRAATEDRQRLGPQATEAEKRACWRAEDEAASLERQCRVEAVEIELALRLALTESPELHEARDLLADGYRARLIEAEAAGDPAAAAEAETLLRATGAPAHLAWLDAGAALTLVTAPAGAVVACAPLVEVDRRRTPGQAVPLGVTPLSPCALPRGRHLLTVTAPGRAPLTLPVVAEREGTLTLGSPGSPLVLPPAADLGPDDVLVPAGDFVYGGDSQTAEPLPRRTLWVDAFIIRRHPVTLGEFIEFLDALTAAGRGERADALAPRLPPQVVGDNPVNPLPKDAAGLRRLPRSLAHLSRYPVLDVSWQAAVAYADWLALRTGQPWRLLHEVEREKAARGTDARLHPWGDFADPAWYRSAVSDPAGPLPVSVDACPADCSVYGAMGLAGNVRDWCLNVWETDGGPFDGHRLVVTRPTDGDGRYRAVRGGAWNASPQLARSCERFVGWPGERYPTTGFRLGRAVTDPPVRAACPTTSR